MTTKTSKKAAQASKKTVTLHIAIPASGKPICGASGKGIKTTLTSAESNCADCQKIAAHAEEKAKTEAKATASKKAEKPEGKKAAKPAPERQRDPRLPPVGTVLVKKDRAGATRCECRVLESTFEYKGQEFRSLSSAAMAAAKDLGIGGQVNGYLFWSLIRQPARETDPVAAQQAAWDRFHERSSRAFTAAKDDEAALTKLKAAIAGQVKKLELLAE